MTRIVGFFPIAAALLLAGPAEASDNAATRLRLDLATAPVIVPAIATPGTPQFLRASRGNPDQIAPPQIAAPAAPGRDKPAIVEKAPDRAPDQAEASPPDNPGILDRMSGSVFENYRAASWWLDEARFELSYALGINRVPLEKSPLSMTMAAEQGTAAVKPPAQPVPRYRLGANMANTGLGTSQLSLTPPPGSLMPAPNVPAMGALSSGAAVPPPPTPAQASPSASPAPIVARAAAAPEPSPQPPIDEDRMEDLAKEIPVLDKLGFDMPQRQEDGSFFIPKSVQRLYGIRTLRALSERRPLVSQLAGQIIPDPDTHGEVEASIMGHFIAPETGLPFVGQSVTKGQIMGYVEPTVGVIERSKIRREIAQLASEIKLTEASIDRLRHFYFVPFREGSIHRAQLALEGFRKEQAALIPMLAAQEILRASTTGVVSTSHAAPGKIVQPGEPVFQIVNPDKLWIQAIAANLEVAEAAGSVARAYAVTPEGQSLDLTFIGSGLALQNQAVPLLFRVDTPITGLRIGRPATVIVESRQKSREGITVPHESVVNSASGVDEVWERIGPESFVPRPVVTEFADGRHLRILAGVTPGASIVTKGAPLLIQIH